MADFFAQKYPLDERNEKRSRAEKQRSIQKSSFFDVIIVAILRDQHETRSHDMHLDIANPERVFEIAEDPKKDDTDDESGKKSPKDESCQRKDLIADLPKKTDERHSYR